MADKVNFNLVSPERELFSATADEVIVPGLEGEFGVFANHSPFMSVLVPGMLVVKDGGSEKKFYVKGGFADVTPEGLTVLAEFAVPVDELKGDLLATQKTQADKDLEAAGEDAELAFLATRTKELLAGL